MIYATGLIIMFILSQGTIIFPDFPVNIRVASFMAFGFHGSTILQSGAYQENTSDKLGEIQVTRVIFNNYSMSARWI